MSSVAIQGNAAGAGVFTVAAPNSGSSYTLTLPTVTGTALTDAGALVISPTGATGYATGAGGAVTQLTNKSTSVTLNKPTGQITMNNAALAATTNVRFQVNNSLIATTDTIIVNLSGGFATGSTYQAWVDGIAAGSFLITLRNISAGSLSEAVVLNFAVIKGVAA
jgi:hypothetical protein